eukprot:TRINITY_DN10208_c1_g1_i1.p1 TRINITY_DN10208_c1_g1~~TRINITY_DN10208_c1_g1_i1.p1  ORF type:complete len:102 (-),score=5.17 TRINITY_DN10208_c1_g1_i1:352-657(-)
MQVSALLSFRQKPVRSSETLSRSSEQASVWEDRSQQPVRSSEHWVGSSEQVSGCDRSGELWERLERRTFCVATARANRMEARVKDVLDGSARANSSSFERT